MESRTIVSIGEVVWDIFGETEVLGGAPVNVAYHIHTLGLPVLVVTRVGVDDLGEKTLARIKALGLPVEGVQRDAQFPTGRVVVTRDRNNEPHFDIVAPAAWDRIDEEAAADIAGDRSFSLVFGTLAQRHETSRAAIRSLWGKAALRFYDVNLRPPFTSRDLVLDSFGSADVVKMNSGELRRIGGWFDPAGKEDRQTALELLSRFRLKALVVTEGGAGAWLLTPEGFFEHPGFQTTVSDTVGAGDAFFAAFIEGYLHRRPWGECLARANHRGAYVASQVGATPVMETYRYPE